MADKTPVLSAQQSRFVDEYMIDWNAQGAAGRAGYSLKNSAAGAHLLRKPQIDTELRKRCLAIQSKLEMGADDVRRGFARIATDPRSPAEGGPSYGDRINALRELGKIFGMYTNKIQVTGSLTLVDLLLLADKADAPHAQPPALPATTH